MFKLSILKILLYNIIVASKTHKVGKSGHPGNDRASPAVIAPE